MAKTKRAPKKRAARQQMIPGTESPSLPELDLAAEEYVEKRNTWQHAHQPMMDAQAEVHALMTKHGLTHYEFNLEGVDYTVDLAASSKVKVKRKKVEENGDDADE